MSEHEHKVWINRKDRMTCKECGEVLGFNESDFPLDEMGLMDMMAVAAMEGLVGREAVFGTDTIVQLSWDIAEAMIVERRRRHE